MSDGFNPLGSGPAPIAARDEIILLQQEEEAALLRAEQAIRRAKKPFAVLLRRAMK